MSSPAAPAAPSPRSSPDAAHGQEHQPRRGFLHVVARGLAAEATPHRLGEGVVVLARPQELPERHAVVPAEAGLEPAVRGHPRAVAVLAEVLAHRADEPDEPLAPGGLAGAPVARRPPAAEAVGPQREARRGEPAADLVRYAWARGALPRFIEQMPFGGARDVVRLEEIRERLVAAGFTLRPDGFRGWGPARHWRARDAAGREGLVGLIGAMSENFCEDCNRARVTADGGFQACLGGQDRVPLRELMRAGESDEAMAEAVRGGLGRKAPRHQMDEAGAGLVLLPMRGIGG